MKNGAVTDLIGTLIIDSKNSSCMKKKMETKQHIRTEDRIANKKQQHNNNMK